MSVHMGLQPQPVAQTNTLIKLCTDTVITFLPIFIITLRGSSRRQTNRGKRGPAYNNDDPERDGERRLAGYTQQVDADGDGCRCNMTGDGLAHALALSFRRMYYYILAACRLQLGPNHSRKGLFALEHYGKHVICRV